MVEHCVSGAADTPVGKMKACWESRNVVEQSSS